MTINWKSYYKDEQLTDYNIKEYKNQKLDVRLFNTNDLDMEGDNQINYLNPYLGELPMMYYIWKNNLKSEFITISQYRRDVTFVDYETIKNPNAIQVICNWGEDCGVKFEDRILIHHDPSGMIREKVWSFLQNYYSLSDEDIEKIQNKTSYNCMAIFVWSMNWDTFCTLCEVIFGILDTLLPNEEWKNVDSILAFRDQQKKLYYEKYPDRPDWVFDNDRYLVFIIEDILSLILSQFFHVFENTKFYDETYLLTNVSKDNTIEEISRWFKLNKKCNPKEVYVNCTDESYYTLYDYFIGEEHNWEYYGIKIVHSIEEIDVRCICLDIHQYIELNIPIDLYMNKYIIKNI